MTTPADSRSRIIGSIRQSLKGARHLPPAPQVTLPPPATGDASMAERFAFELAQLSGKSVSLPAAEARLRAA